MYLWVAMEPLAVVKFDCWKAGVCSGWAGFKDLLKEMERKTFIIIIEAENWFCQDLGFFNNFFYNTYAVM